jgi:hypothetical protein
MMLRAGSSTGLSPPSMLDSPTLTEPGPGPMSPWLPLWAGALMLVIVSATGLAWARAMLPNSDQLTRVGLSPAIGFAALGLGSIAVDATGLRLSGTGG